MKTGKRDRFFGVFELIGHFVASAALSCLEAKAEAHQRLKADSAVSVMIPCQPSLTPELSRAVGVGLDELLGRWPVMELNMRNDEKMRFYVGIRHCGCITASLVDDENTTPKEIAEFARDMQKSKRRMEHRELTRQEFSETLVICQHQKRPNDQVQP